MSQSKFLVNCHLMGELNFVSKEAYMYMYLATVKLLKISISCSEYISGGTLRQVLKDKVRKVSAYLVPTNVKLRYQ